MVSEFTVWFGRLTLDEAGELIDCHPFEKNPDILAERLLELQEGGQKVPATAPDLRRLAFDCGFVDMDEDYDVLLRDVCIRAAKNRISSTDTDDVRIVHAVEALDDIDKNVNELSERLLEWYGLYFPELELTGEPLSRFVLAFGSRANVPDDHPLFEKASKSMGSELSFADEELLRSFASNLCSLYDTRRHIESYIVTGMGSLAPNLADVAGALLGARLISIAGSLQKLASFPSSTVQVIGANRALFKHLRSNTPPPKHGIIFNNIIIKNAPWWQRGKLARAFAAKISLASRTDFYSGKKDPSIKEKLELKLTAIRNANPSPPKKETKPGGKASGARGKGRKKKGGKR
ncbi:NOP5/NOP56 family protein [Methanolobus halotolerans]|uniref:rRNA biogenesis protein n=1 Tax=Methanolobus halotolerans TaxID=2052935 RepID=A0A4E0QTH4_9EURY|nr:NOP5/NOP56 family protein [Methanolobus halotolerans]TGC11141.1 rRNA biogenesis protein [Methanolobus halotolerans]